MGVLDVAHGKIVFKLYDEGLPGVRRCAGVNSGARRLGNRSGGGRRRARGRRWHVLGRDVVDEVFDGEEGPAAAVLGAYDLLVPHDAGGDGGLSGGPSPRVARAPSAGGTPA